MSETSGSSSIDTIDMKEIEPLLFPQGTDFDADRQKMLFEQYKILAQSSEQLAARRQTVNGFFLSLNTFMMAGLGFIFKESFELFVHEHKLMRLMSLAIAVALVGLFVDINWSRLIESYGKLLQIQVRVMESLEKHLQAAVVTAQLAFHRDDYNSLSRFEKNIAHTFQVIYAVSAIGALVLMFVHPFPQVPVTPVK